MSTVQSLGIGSGLNINEIVTALVDAERVPTETSLDNKKALAESKISAYGEFATRLSALQTSVSSLRLQTNFNQISATSSDTSTFTASASSLADPGTYSVVVNETAQAQVLSSAAYSTVNDTIGTGTLTLRFGTTSTGPYGFTQDTSVAEQTITVDGQNNTLSTLRDYINGGSYGVDASIVNDGTGFRLVLTAAESGANNSVQIEVAGDGDGSDIDTTGLSALRFDGVLQAMTQNLEGVDAAVNINGIAVTSETNTISDAVNGISFNLVSKDAGVTKTLTVSRDTSQFSEQIEGFVAAFNEVATFVSEQTAYDPTTQTAGLFAGDSTIRNAFAQLRSTLFSSVSGVNTPLRALTDIGILSSRSDGTIAVDQEELNAVLNQPEQLGNLFSLSGQATDPLVSFVSATSATKAGTYYLNVTQTATRAEIQGDSVLPFNTLGNLTIGSTNDTFAVRVDGNVSGTISIDRQTYTSGESLAAEIQSKINADSALAAAGASVSVEYDDANNRFNLFSNLYGSGSKIAITSIGDDVDTDLGFNVVSGTSGKNVAGSISTTQATQAQYTTSGALAYSTGGSVNIDATNDEFTIRIDGTTSGSITLNAGNYATGNDLAAELQTRINLDANLATANKSVSVTYDSSNHQLRINSSTYGSSSRVEMVSFETGAPATLGFFTGNGTPGVGTIDTTQTQGDGRFLLVTSGEARGLKIDVNGGNFDANFGVNRGAITFSRGVADQIDSLITSLLDEGGLVESRTTGLQATIDGINDDKDDLNRYIASLETRLLAQFSAMDALVGQLNNLSSFLSSALGALPGAGGSTPSPGG